MESTAKSNNQQILNNQKSWTIWGEYIEIGVNIYNTNYQKDFKTFPPQILYQCVC